MLTRRALLSTAAALGLAITGGTAVRAQSYPTRPIRLVVPFPPGGPTDVMARLVAERLAARLGQSVVVENRPGGAGGTVGAKAVAAADPDGYTLLLALTGTLTITPAIYKDAGYDPLKSFTPVATVSSSAQLLTVHPSLPATTLQELVGYAKANPRKLSYASPGFGTQPHLLGELLKWATETDIAHVPYRGSAPAITDLVAGQVHMMFDAPTVLLSHVEAGTLRAIAVTSEARAARLPQVPTVTEAGVPKLSATLWSGIVAPAGTPAGIVTRLNGDINDDLRSADMQASLAKFGAEARIASPQEFSAFLAAETERWAALVKTANIKAE